MSSPVLPDNNNNNNSNTKDYDNNDNDDKDEVVVLQNALYRVRAVNNKAISWIPFRVEIQGPTVGKVTRTRAPLFTQLLLKDTRQPIFELVVVPQQRQQQQQQQQQPEESFHSPQQSQSQKSQPSETVVLCLTRWCGTTCEERTRAVAEAMNQWKEQGVIHGWRNEMYPVSDQFHSEPPLFLMERAAIPFLGIRQYSVHVMGILPLLPSQEQQQELQQPAPHKVWMARRSKTKAKHPGMIDPLVAGGYSAGCTVWENLLRECWEEAGIPPSLAQTRLRSTGAISYEYFNPTKDTITRCVCFLFDFWSPINFIPTGQDGEVEEFFSWSIPQLKQSLAPHYPDPLKPNSYLVIVDWLLRHGFFSPDTPGYLDLVRELHFGECQ